MPPVTSVPPQLDFSWVDRWKSTWGGRFSDIAKRYSTLLSKGAEEVTKRPIGTAVETTGASLLAPFKALFMAGKGALAMGKEAALATASAVSAKPDEAIAHATTFVDALTAGFLTHAPEYVRRDVEAAGGNWNDMSPGQKAAAVGSWLVSGAPADLVALNLAEPAEAAAASFEKGDLSGGMAGLLLLGASLMGLRTVPRTRVFSQRVRQFSGSRFPSKADIAAAVEKAKNIGNAGRGSDPIIELLRQLQEQQKDKLGQAAAEAQPVKAVQPGQVAEVVQPEKPGGVVPPEKPSGVVLPEKPGGVVLPEQAVGKAEQAADAATQKIVDDVLSVIPAQEIGMNTFRQILRRAGHSDPNSVIESLISAGKLKIRKETGNFLIVDNIGHGTLSVNDLANIVGHTKTWDELQKAFTAEDPTAHVPRVPDEVFKESAGVALVSIMEANKMANFLEHFTLTMPSMFRNLDPKRFGRFISEVMRLDPRRTANALGAILEGSPKHYLQIVPQVADLFDETTSTGGRILQALSDVQRQLGLLSYEQRRFLHRLVSEYGGLPTDEAFAAYRMLRNIGIPANSAAMSMLSGTFNKMADAVAAARQELIGLGKIDPKVKLEQALSGKVPKEQLGSLVEDKLLQAELKTTGQLPIVVKKETAIKAAEDPAAAVTRGERIVLLEDPWPDKKLEDIPEAFRTAVARVRANAPRGVDVAASRRVAEEYLKQAASEYMTDLESKNVAKMWLHNTSPLTRAWGMFESARSSLALANPRSAVRDFINSNAVFVTRLMDMGWATLIDSMIPGKARTLDAMLYTLSEVARTAWKGPLSQAREFSRLIDNIPDLVEEATNLGIPVETFDNLVNYGASMVAEKSNLPVYMTMGMAGANLLRGVIDRFTRQVIGNIMLPYHMVMQGIEIPSGVRPADVLVKMLENGGEDAAKAKTAIYSAMLEGRAASMALDPVTAGDFNRVIKSGKLEKSLEEALGVKKVKLVPGQLESAGSAILNTFKRVPILYSLASMYPRFFYNLFTYMADHSPIGLAGLADDQFRMMLKSSEPAIRMLAVDQLAKSINGMVMLFGGFVASKTATAKPYLVEIATHDDEKGVYKETVDIRNYRPFDLYVTAAMVIDHLLFGGPAPNLNANEWFDTITGLRRMTDQPISALFPIMTAVAEGTPEGRRIAIEKLAAQELSPLLTPIQVIREAAYMLTPFMFDNPMREFSTQYDTGNRPLVGSATRAMPKAADQASRWLYGNDPVNWIPPKVNPYGTYSESAARNIAFWLFGVTTRGMSRLEYTLTKLGIDPVKIIDPTERTGAVANLYRKIYADMLNAPLSSSDGPGDILAGLMSGMGMVMTDQNGRPMLESDDPEIKYFRTRLQELVKASGLTREQLMKGEEGNLDIRHIPYNVSTPRQLLKYVHNVYVAPANLTKEELNKLYSSPTFGDYLAQIIENDKIASRFRMTMKKLGMPEAEKEQMSVDDARRFMAKDLISVVKLRAFNNIDILKLFMSADNPHLLGEDIFKRLPEELSNNLELSFKALAAKDPQEVQRMLILAGQANNPITGPAILGEGGKQ